MSSLTYYNEKGAGEQNGAECHYSQAVVIGPIVKCSGQGGWTNNRDIPMDNKQQIINAFDNVERVLQAAGLKGWEDVYSIRSYHVDIASTFQLMVDILKERCPKHKPIWTSIGVTRLAFPSMLIEIEVEAYKPSA